MSVSLAGAVTLWFDSAARDLPWRSPDTTPWGVLVSEIMLQQTPVSRVTPAWLSWLARWPTPAAMAADPDQPAAAIRMWGRLGYPRRALRLYECAVAAVERHGGEIPSDLDALLALPGVGSYTARAVAAFAFGQRHPVVDTNVRRFVARAVGGRAEAGPATTQRDLDAVAALLPEAAADAARASAAFMELGAVVCVARSPRCAACPVATTCAWRRAGSPPAEVPGQRTQTYAGTDRQVRGLLLAVLRDADTPVPATRLDIVWPDAVQRDRALATLLADGLVVTPEPGRYALPGAR
ncbi:A/G-specific adenine glycosylase [Virgisporangium aurantiacum]|uniref:Adenine DNA glycosylase n=1 Tax=Virgisporangium aurantiacum TaxID=175570 RepID=A0A8J3Z087_9ACTN|nr:A/G-specific adenine glycosylase [Virgisporangium aurantiacum]GIJ54032.1 A/G-specific adenine glycosylase [Virgisporangium aurantiacum]